MPNPCSWCIVAAGATPNPGDSHGICARHSRELLYENPLLTAIGTLRGGAYLNAEAREALARDLERVVRRFRGAPQDLAPGSDSRWFSLERASICLACHTVYDAALLACPRCLSHRAITMGLSGDAEARRRPLGGKPKAVITDAADDPSPAGHDSHGRAEPLSRTPER